MIARPGCYVPTVPCHYPSWLCLNLRAYLSAMSKLNCDGKERGQNWNCPSRIASVEKRTACYSYKLTFNCAAITCSLEPRHSFLYLRLLAIVVPLSWWAAHIHGLFKKQKVQRKIKLGLSVIQVAVRVGSKSASTKWYQIFGFLYLLYW